MLSAKVSKIRLSRAVKETLSVFLLILVTVDDEKTSIIYSLAFIYKLWLEYLSSNID